ncbi:MAG: hypothetical protein P8Y99_10200 [Calditrichaceae bacterium]
MDSQNIVLYGKKQKSTEQILQIIEKLHIKVKYFHSQEELIKNLNKHIFDLLIYIENNDEQDLKSHLQKLKDAHPALLICLIGLTENTRDGNYEFYFHQKSFNIENAFENFILNVIAGVNREKNYTNLSSMILHDLRSPVQSISGYLDLLENGVFGQLNKGQLNILHKTSFLANKIIDLLEDLNKIYMFEINKFELHLSKFRLKDLIDQSLRSLWIQSDQKNIKLLLNVDSKMLDIYADSNFCLIYLTNITGQIEPNRKQEDLDWDCIFLNSSLKHIMARLELIIIAKAVPHFILIFRL